MSIQLFKCPQDNEIIDSIIPKIEYTNLLDPMASDDKIEQTCRDVEEFGFGFAVQFCGAQEHVMRRLKPYGTRFVMGLGDAGTIEGVLSDAKNAMDKGCCELDMALKLPLFFDHKYDQLQSEIHQVAELAKSYDGLLKIIIETGFLTDAEKLEASRLALDAGATFIKTNLGMRPGRSNMHDILLLKDAFGDRVKIKASGLVPSLEDAYSFIQAGADRVAMRNVLADQLRRIGYKRPENRK